jgi:RecA/RadA recombinase
MLRQARELSPQQHAASAAALCKRWLVTAAERAGSGPAFSTGSLSLDVLLGGGFPAGAIVEARAGL